MENCSDKITTGPKTKFSNYEIKSEGPYHITSPKSVLTKLVKLQKYTLAKKGSSPITKLDQMEFVLKNITPASSFLQETELNTEDSYRPNELITIVHYSLAGIGKSHLTKLFKNMANFYKINFFSVSTDEISEDLIKEMMLAYPNMTQNQAFVNTRKKCS